MPQQENRNHEIKKNLSASAFRSFFVYCLFGAMATGLETFLYWAFYEVSHFANLVATFCAWFITMIFCFFTNKIFVYQSKEWGTHELFKELCGFYSCRLSTGILNMAFMYVTVDVLSLWPVPMKLSAALMVGIINYLVGQFLVFAKKK